jgi:two-component system, NarL family, response regulator DevR
MSELIVVVGPAGMERHAIQKSVEITGEFRAVAATSLSALESDVTAGSGFTCLLQMEGGVLSRSLISSWKKPGKKGWLHMLVEMSTTPETWLLDGLRNGAAGVISWPVLATDLRAAINAARRREAVLTPKAAGLLMGRMRGEDESSSLSINLTKREREIVQHLRSGQSNRDIAESLKIAEGTVECHLSSIYRKIGVQSRSEAVANFALRTNSANLLKVLTPAELQVVKRVLEGLGNDQIAGALNLSRHTVETHLSHVYRKLAVRSRIELISRTAND